MITIKIPTLRDFLIWLKIRKYTIAQEKTDANWKAVKLFYDRIIWHIDREPIPQENKDYLKKKVTEERGKVRLYRVYPHKEIKNK